MGILLFNADTPSFHFVLANHGKSLLYDTTYLFHNLLSFLFMFYGTNLRGFLILGALLGVKSEGKGRILDLHQV